jgi:KDO2-lipid IV(A) lauroyltransferase
VVRLTGACTAALEQAIRRNPAEWVWMHERWKTRPKPEPSKRDAEKSERFPEATGPGTEDA